MEEDCKAFKGLKKSIKGKLVEVENNLEEYKKNEDLSMQSNSQSFFRSKS